MAMMVTREEGRGEGRVIQDGVCAEGEGDVVARVLSGVRRVI